MDVRTLLTTVLKSIIAKGSDLILFPVFLKHLSDKRKSILRHLTRMNNKVMCSVVYAPSLNLAQIKNDVTNARKIADIKEAPRRDLRFAPFSCEHLQFVFQFSHFN